MSSTMDERIARLEAINEQIRDRLNSIDARLDGMELRVESRFGQIDNRFMWLTGIVIGTWITTILTIVFHH